MRYSVTQIESYYKVSYSPSYYKVTRIEVEDALIYMVDSYGNRVKDSYGNDIILPQ